MGWGLYEIIRTDSKKERILQMAKFQLAAAVDSLMAVKELVYERDEGRGMRDGCG